MPTKKPQPKTLTFKTGFGERAVLMPDMKPTGKVALVCLHGFYGTAKQLFKQTGFTELALESGIPVFYPQGFKGTWAVPGGVSPANKAGVDDVAFLKNFVEDVAIEKYGADERKIVFMGISLGGGMAVQMGLEWLYDANLGIIAFTLAKGQAEAHPGYQPCKVVMFNGTRDPIVSFTGGVVKKIGVEVLSAGDTIEFWVKRGGSDAHVTAYSGPWGHSWPGCPAASDKILGGNTTEIDASRIIWDHFTQ